MQTSDTLTRAADKGRGRTLLDPAPPGVVPVSESTARASGASSSS